MPLTRKETKAVLAIVWSACNDAYLLGWKHGQDGLENATSPWSGLTNVAALGTLQAQDIADLSKRIEQLAKSVE